MIGLIQRVRSASVTVDNDIVGEIAAGLLVLVGVRRDDTHQDAERLLERLLGYRVFEDESGRMNNSLRDTGGGLLLVPQFTLAADTRKGTRASFTPAAPPAEAERLFQQLVELAGREWSATAAGRFGANMQVALVNDGPVTFWLETR